MKQCKQCSAQFEITDEDRKFYERMDISEPTSCPKCRQRCRLAWGNQINLYKRKCDATGKEIISAYHPDSPLKVFSQPFWWSDEFDATEYGRDFDFNRPFFEQWYELAKVVPRPNLHTGFQFDENSSYTNYAGHDKNCYMIFDSDYNWDCYYGMSINKSRTCIDNNRVKECELCFECVDCVRCYELKYSQDCENCNDSAFLKNCIGCKRCFMCSNMKNKEYCVYNQQYDQETYEKLINSLSSHSELAKYFKDWEEFKLRYPQKFTHGVQNENVTGDYLINCKNATKCFDSMDLWDCRYFTRAFGAAKDCMDCDECGDQVELLHGCSNCGYNIQNMRFSHFCFSEGHDLDYCFYCHFSHDCLGCIGLTRKSYCIFNKQYSKEEYETLAPKIIEYMKKTGEWGEFFPIEMSDFAYNESIAHEYLPLTKEEVLAKKCKWREPDKKEYLPATAEIPDDSKDATDSLCNEVFACEDCGRNYKIVEQELRFYKSQKVTLPKKCFYCRHKKRFDLRNKRDLYDRTCDKCQAEILTTYATEQPDTVYCEKCYLESLH
jgi:hypothetical protein